MENTHHFHGARYRYMVVLDADSLMTGKTLRELVRRMEENPQVGLIQVPSYPVNQDSLFARIQQFSSMAYGPMVMTGLNFWQFSEGNYWGHNAIIRIEPFMRYCELPPLPGREPFGGEIWSHDFLEAALMRQAGWEVWLAPDLAGSYEEVPPTLVDYAKRDRRWCQGNIQHVRFLFARLHPVSRLHLVMGILSYITSPLWLLLVAITGLAPFIRPISSGPGSFGPAAGVLLALVLTLLFFPRILGWILLLRNRSIREAFGGARKATLSILLETIFWFVLTPIMMMFKTQFVILTLLRHKIQWAEQRREGREMKWKEAVAVHGWQSLLGLAAGVMTCLRGDVLFWWFGLTLLWPIFSIPFSVLMSTVSVGEKAKRTGLFLIPEETRPPPILNSLMHYLRKDLPSEAPEPPAAVLLKRTFETVASTRN